MIRLRDRAIAEQRMLGEGDRELFVPGRAPCLVAFHGFGGTAAELRPVLDAVAGAGFAVDAGLLLGHGTRVEELQNLRLDDWLGEARPRMRRAIEEHGRIVLLGFSLGSLVALELASERPDGLVGLAVLGNALTLHAYASGPLALWDRAGWTVPDAYFTKPFAGDVVDKGALASLVAYDRHPLRAALEVYRAGQRVRRVVGKVACPTLILHGRRDRVCPWKNATWLAERVGGGDVTVRVFERSAHVLACDGEREDVAREVVRFVQRLA